MKPDDLSIQYRIGQKVLAFRCRQVGLIGSSCLLQPPVSVGNLRKCWVQESRDLLLSKAIAQAQKPKLSASCDLSLLIPTSSTGSNLFVRLLTPRSETPASIKLGKHNSLAFIPLEHVEMLTVCLLSGAVLDVDWKSSVLNEMVASYPKDYLFAYITLLHDKCKSW